MENRALTRRTFVAAGAAGLGGLALAACQGSTSSAKRGSGLNLLPVTPSVATGKSSRLVFVLQDDNRDPITPKVATFRFGPNPDHMTSPAAQAEVHSDAATASSYLKLSVQLSPAGTVWAEVTADGRRATAPITVVDHVVGIGSGESLPSVVTPSPGNLAGLEVACTRQPVCSFHDVSLDKALTLGVPLAVLVATPAFCQSAVCGPVLEVLVKAAPAYAGKVRFVHLEVYAERPKERIEGTPLAPAVKAFGLESEPSLFLVRPDRTVRDRIDGVFGLAEVDDALTALVKG